MSERRRHHDSVEHVTREIQKIDDEWLSGWYDLPEHAREHFRAALTLAIQASKAAAVARRPQSRSEKAGRLLPFSRPLAPAPGRDQFQAQRPRSSLRSQSSP